MRNMRMGHLPLCELPHSKDSLNPPTATLPIEETGTFEFYPDLDTNESLPLVRFPITASKRAKRNTLVDTAAYQGVADILAIPPILYTPLKTIPVSSFETLKNRNTVGDYQAPCEYIVYKGE